MFWDGNETFFDIEIRQGNQWVSINEEPDLFEGVESVHYDDETNILKITAKPDTSCIRPIPKSHILVNGKHPEQVFLVI